MDASRPEEVFFNDLDPDDAAAFAARLTHQGLDAGTPLTAAAWRHLPTSYVPCELDLAVPLAAQELMGSRTGRVHRMQAGHSPFLSRPAELAALIRTDTAAFTAAFSAAARTRIEAR